MSNVERILWVAGTAVAVAALGLTGTIVPGEQEHEHPVTVEVSRTLVCPALDPTRGTATVAAFDATGDVSAQSLSSGSTRRQLTEGEVTLLEKSDGAVRLDLASGAVGGGSAITAETAGLERGLSAVGCGAPDTHAMFVGVRSGRSASSDVVLTNTDDTAASVDLVIYGAAGRVAAAGSRSVDVPAGSSVRVALGPLVTTEDVLGVEVVTTQGRVAAVVRTRVLEEGQADGGGVEWLAPIPEARTESVVAVAGGEGARSLVVTNPGGRLADVRLELLTPEGPQTIPGFEGVSVGPEATAAFPVEPFLKGVAGDLRLVSSQPVAAAAGAVAGEKGDFAVAGAQPAFTGRSLLPLAAKGLGGSLQLANPGDTAATARIVFRDQAGGELSSRTVTLDAGSIVSEPLPQGDVVVVDVDVTDGSLTGVVVLTREAGEGIAGLAVVPLTGEARGDVVVDPRRDPGYASSS